MALCSLTAWRASSSSTVTLLSSAVFEHFGVFFNFMFIPAVMQRAVIHVLIHITACSVAVSIRKEDAWCVQQPGEPHVPFPK